MAKEVIGVVEQMLDRKTDKGEEYVVLRIEGEGYFDWIDLAAEKRVAVGDRVRLRVSDGQWPKTLELEKLPQKQAKGKTASAQGNTPVSPGMQKREETITRLSCIRTAAVALSHAEIPQKELEQKFLGLAEQLEKWVGRSE